jgi:HEAT repeat protein
MSDVQGKNDAPEPPAPPVEKEIPLDTRLLSEAVIELNISRKNVGIYPPGHIQITKSIDRAFTFLERLFEIRSEMTLGVAKDTLLVGQDYLDQKNPVYRDFAVSMNQRGIAAVTFIRGLDKEELTRFHRILTTKPDDITAADGIEKVMAESSIRHIRVMAVDYGSFHVTEEQEIAKPQGKADEKQDLTVWQDFVSHLSAGTLAGPGQGVSLKDAEKIDPLELAKLLNERQIDSYAALQSYDRIISTHIRGAAERKQLTPEQTKTLASLNDLLRELHPDLRKQFLSVAFARVTSSGSFAGAEEIIGGMTDDMVIEMLTQASTEGREISPTLAGLVVKLAGTQHDSPAGTYQAKAMQPGGGAVPLILPEDLQTLFDREKYEEYVSADYGTMLREMAEGPGVSLEQAPLQEYEKSFEDEHLDFQIGRAILAFMEEDIDEEDYREFARKLVAISPGFLETGNFELLWDIAETLRRHAADKAVPGIRDLAEESRKLFSDPEFILKALSSFEIWMKDKGQEAAGLIRSLGPATIPGLMDIFSKDETFGGRRVLFNLLCMFGEPAVQEAQKRLRDPRPYYVRNLLIFIRRAGSPSSVPHIKPLVRHQNQMVKMEALSALLKFKEPDAVTELRNAIRSEDPDVAAQAVALAGQYRVSEVTEDVLSRIKRAILFETDYATNEEVIRALGDIGDPRAIPDLEKLARTGFTLYRQSTMRMKETIYESLTRYPRERLTNLIRIGEGLQSDKIRRICRKLAEQAG